MKLQTYNRPDVFNELELEWNDLVQRSTGDRIFSTWEWQSVWWDAYQPGELWVVTCRDENNRLVGLAPWFIGIGDDGRRFVSTIGCKEVTDYLDLIVDQNHVDPVLQTLAQFLADNRSVYDSIELCNVPEQSISCAPFPRYLQQCGFAITIEYEDVCPIIHLPDSWSAYLEMLDKKQRHELRRKLRRVQGVNTDVNWYTVGQEHNLEEEIGHFLDMMAASSPDKANFLSDPHNVIFFKSITSVLMDRGWLQLNFLIVNGERAAAYLNFDYNRHILVYNSGLRSDKYGHLSAGIVLLALTIQHAIETGHEVFDFLQGNEAYKYHLGGKDTAVLNVIARYAG